MQTAAGGPIKKPIKRQKDGYRYIPDEENGGWDRISDNSMSDVFATMEFTPKKTNVGSSITRKQSTPSKTYYSAYNPDDVVKGFNALTLGGLNNLSPTQWARRAYDTGKLLTGNMTWSGYTDSWINGNNGVVSQNFKEEHPVLSNSINGGIDLATFSLPKVSLYPVHFVQQVAKPITSTYIGTKLGEEVDKYLPKKIKGYGEMLGYMLGVGVGTGFAYKNYSNIPLIHTKYKKLNDVINYPITTAAATVKGKYPWTKKQDIKLKRQLFDDIEEARNFQLKSGYLLEDQPAIRIAKKSQYLEGELGHYTPYYNTVTVKSTINPGFKGLVNHELTHGRQQYFGAFSEFDPKAGYYIPRKDIKTPVFDPFRKKKAGSWTASPDEFDAELSNLQISTGKLPTEPVDNIFPLQTRFGIWNKNKAREIENLILQLRKNREFFKDGGKMNILEFLKNGSGIHIKEKNKGKFTSYCGGKVTDECIQKGKNSSNPAIRKRATFAANARKWKHKEGGIIKGQFGLGDSFWNFLYKTGIGSKGDFKRMKQDLVDFGILQDNSENPNQQIGGPTILPSITSGTIIEGLSPRAGKLANRAWLENSNPITNQETLQAAKDWVEMMKDKMKTITAKAYPTKRGRPIGSKNNPKPVQESIEQKPIKLETDYTQSGTSLERAVEGKRYGISRKGRVSSNDRNARAMESGDARTTNAGYTNVKKGQIRQVENNLDKYPEHERKALEQRLLRLYRKNRPESEINKVKREFYKYLAKKYGYFKIGGIIKASDGTKTSWISNGLGKIGNFFKNNELGQSILSTGVNLGLNQLTNSAHKNVISNEAEISKANLEKNAANEKLNNSAKAEEMVRKTLAQLYDKDNPNAFEGDIVKGQLKQQFLNQLNAPIDQELAEQKAQIDFQANQSKNQYSIGSLGGLSTDVLNAFSNSKKDTSPNTSSNNSTFGNYVSTQFKNYGTFNSDGSMNLGNGLGTFSMTGGYKPQQFQVSTKFSL